MLGSDSDGSINQRSTRKKRHRSRSSKSLIPSRSSSSGRSSSRRNGRKRSKSKKRKKKTSKFGFRGKGNRTLAVKSGVTKNNETKSTKDMPIITEEDLEDGSFSDSYIPPRFGSSGFFSYHTWGKQNVRPPDEDRVVRSGPSIWHWPWDLSFGLYDDLYDHLVSDKAKDHRHRGDYESLLEDTWLNMDGPIPSWQPLFAAVIWFILSINILFPVSMISQATPCPHEYYLHDVVHAVPRWSVDIATRTDSEWKPKLHVDSASLITSNWHSIERVVHIRSDWAHLQVGFILFSFEIASWISSPISSFLILRTGPSWMLLVGTLLMTASSIGMSFCWNWFDLTFVLSLISLRIVSGIGFNLVRQSTLFLWSCFAKLDLLASGLGLCVGPVLGDLLYTYCGIEVAFMSYAAMQCLVLFAIIFVAMLNLLKMDQISRLEIPAQIQNVRKPRYDLLYHHRTTLKGIDITAVRRCTLCGRFVFIALKCEVLMVTICSLIALEPTLPVYALDPSLEITVSGSLFTFVYLPMLALASLIGLLYARSSSKYLLKSPKRHIRKQRGGMKYITKMRSVNAQSVKSERIKLVENPQWMAQRKRLMPSPDISQHHIVMILGITLNASGYICLSGGSKVIPPLLGSSDGVHLLLGLVLISCGSAAVIASVIDSFINGVNLSINQTKLSFVALNVSILMGPVIGGLGLDLVENDAPVLFEYIGLVMAGNLAIYLLALTVQYLWRCGVRLGCGKNKGLTAEENERKDNAVDIESGNVNGSGLSINGVGSVNVFGLKQRVNSKVKKQGMDNMGQRVYIYGTDLRHLCWWKRGLNVRFPYVQWMESGWSSTQRNSEFL